MTPTPTAHGAAPAAATAARHGRAPTASAATPASGDGAGDAFAALLQSLGDAALPAQDAAPTMTLAEGGTPTTAASDKPADKPGAPPTLADLLPPAPCAQPAMSELLALASGTPAARAHGPATAAGDTAHDATPAGRAETKGRPHASEANALLDAGSPASAPAAQPSPASPRPDFATLLATHEGRREPRTHELTAAAPHALHALAAADTPPAPAAPANAAPVHQASLPSQPLDSAFAGDVAGEVKLMIEGGLQQAELHLNPAELGPIRIELNLSGQTADLSFAAAHETTRAGLEQALPALREMLAADGVTLGQAGVGAGTQQQQHDMQQQAREAVVQQQARRAGGGVPAPAPEAPRASVRPLHAGRGVLDLYA